MSVSALLHGIYETLLKDTSINKENCGIQEDGQPGLIFPDYYVAIHLVDWSPGTPPVDTGLYEKYAFACTVTRRIASSPVSRTMTLRFIDQVEGIEKIARKINRTVNLNYELLQLANNHLHDSREWIVEPLRWSGTTAPRVVGADWVWSDANEPRAALVTTSTFTGAGRDQPIDNVE